MKKIMACATIFVICLTANTTFAVDQTVIIDLSKYKAGDKVQQAFPQPFSAGQVQCYTQFNKANTSIYADGHKLTVLKASNPRVFHLKQATYLSAENHICKHRKIRNKYPRHHSCCKPFCELHVTCKNI